MLTLLAEIVKLTGQVLSFGSFEWTVHQNQA